MKGLNDHTTAGPAGGVFAQVAGLFGYNQEQPKPDDAQMIDAAAAKNFEFQVKYFPIDDGSALPGAAAADPSVYAQFEAVLTCEQFSAFTGQDLGAEKPQSSNKGKHLMLFNDRSGSMAGTPLATLKKACVKLADTVFGDEGCPESNQFEQVHTYFYDDTITGMATQSKKQYVDYIQAAQYQGRTNFANCYREILKVVEGAAAGGEYFILFMTDGLDNASGPAELKTRLEQMSATFAQLAASKGVSVTIYCMGLSSGHDARLLNALAQAGTQTGNFIYIDTQHAGYQDQLDAAVGESLGLAVARSTQPRMTLANASTSFRETQMCEITHEFEEAKEAAVDPQAAEEAKEEAKVEGE